MPKSTQIASERPMSSRLQEIVAAIHRRALPEPEIELERFAKEETCHQQAGRDRRRFRRYSLITNVIVVPLNGLLVPAGDPFVALSSGMSIDGLRLIHTDPPPSDHLFIEVEGQPVRFVLTVLRSRSIGPCCEIAGRLTSASVLDSEPHGSTEPAVSRAASSGDPFPPTLDEFAQWAGVTAALPLLGKLSAPIARSGHFREVSRGRSNTATAFGQSTVTTS
jgi:hypothetical protein